MMIRADDDDRLLLRFQREQQQSATWKKTRRKRNKKFFSLFAVVSFVVFLSISFWFTEETENMEKVFEREDFKGFVKEVRNANAQMRAHEERMATVKIHRRRCEEER